MARYIDADEAYEIGKKMRRNGENNVTDLSSVRAVLEATPTADVVEVKHGRWKHRESTLGWQDFDYVECSECGESWVLDGDFDFNLVTDFWHYCPNCGAKMDGGNNEA